MTDHLELTLPNQLEAISGVQDQVEGFAARNGLGDRLLHDVQLALEEHLTNIVSYAYTDKRLHQIRVSLHLDATRLRVEIEDDGAPFNPLAHPPPDRDKPIEERPIGGLGVHMMRQAVDEMAYRRERGANILVMTKHLPVGGA
jgi:anti-sigma regulatory factor (Ser/Thr protein kinase)